MYSQPDIGYDSIVFESNPSELIVEKEKKYGLAKITTLKYKELKRLNEYLFIRELFDGRKVYVDTQGREYFLRK
ncbi:MULTISPECIES: hypothetical protein [Myroides]|uniref:Uncharacterized protein n=1 Tax=Myroides albus TaxID=2562892 RepID=A0A6I3LH17_9FLAO|nr:MULTISPECIES: hypothetical protein [Myroides]MTG97788.1 hypothetical protein [Myroides albus]MVX34880.1 hypothetical protein [Myroides sp. LoEW2-1]UVD79745.1 hypothetical protein NWE55_00170 [Myroides albus]